MPDVEPTGNNGAGGQWAMRQLLKERTKNLARSVTKLQEVQAQLKALEAERDAAVKERETAVERARTEYDATGLKTENERLKGEIRERDHNALFNRLALERGAYEDTLELIRQQSGYKAEADTPDPEAIGTMLDAMKGRPGTARLFGSGEAPPPASPPPGSGQGRRDVAPGKWRVTTDQMRDGAWCMANAQRLREARQEGKLEIVQSP